MSFTATPRSRAVIKSKTMEGGNKEDDLLSRISRFSEMYSGCENIRPKNPRQTCNLLSFLTFSYTIPLFKKGFKGNLQEPDIYEVPDSCNSKKCGDKIDKDWHHCKTALRLLIRRFGSKYFLYTAVHLTWHLIESTIYPYAMSRFIAYFEKNQTNISKFDANYYGGAIILFSLLKTLWIHNYFMLECTLGLQIRSSLSSLIYRKVVKLQPQQTKKGSSMGGVVTVLTKDMRTVETTIWPLSDMIIGWFKFVYITYLMYLRIGTPSLITTAVMAFVIVIEVIMSRFVLKSRLRVGKMSDKRLHFTKEILSALKIIKMYTWEAFFHDRVCKARKKETSANLKAWFLGSIISALGMLFAKLLFPIFLLTYMSLGYPMNIELVYYLLGLFKEQADVIGIYLPSGFGLGAEFYASVVRIGKILNMDEPETVRDGQYSKNPPPDKTEITLHKVSVTIDGDAILDDVSFCIDQPGLYVITGPLGSGKSSVLKVILEEYPVSTGTLKIAGNISYACQDPWVFPATVKQNILFGQPFNRERYDKIIEICSLRYDLDILPCGDDTVIIDGGLNLSKGQQARVNLARAVYKDSQIYLLDDPLASLDVKVQDDIFHGCIKDFLKNKIVILITQNTAHLKYGRRIVVMERSQIGSIMVPSDELVDHDTVSKHADSGGGNVADLKAEEKAQVNIYHEDKQTGGVDVTYYFRYVKYGGGVLIFALLISVFFGAQFTESYADKLMSMWVDYQQNILKDNEKTKGQNSTSAYESTSLERDNTFDLYIIMIIASTAIDLLKSYWFLVYCRKASIKFHKLMSNAIINCVMPYLDNHFIGNILNRFSYDLDHIDEVFPFLLKDLIVLIFAIGATLILIVTVNWIFLLIAVLFFITLALLRIFYIPTARALKRLGATTRSPYIGHLNATVEGLSTIKAFKAENLLKDEFDKHQDLAISVAYMEMTTARAFGYALDMDCSIFISTVILTFLFISTDTSVGNVGLALTQIFRMTGNLHRLIRVWASLEQCMTSVERVIEYIEIPRENKLGQTPPKWPKHGRIEFQNVNLVYNFESKVLKNVSFEINPGDNIGIVGRTGAGKSSVISALFRLYEYQGKILIDGVDIVNVSLELLRKNLSIIPQDPIIFAGTIRENVDPYATVLDKDIWKALKTVNVHNSIPNLDANIFDLTLSTGQKQLLCLARALIKNNRIVVMDEPTANFDPDTDAMIYGLIKQHFDRCTVIMVAHRLKSTIDCDKVVVMDNGEIVEFDQPTKLLEDKRSLFYQMMNIVE